VVHALCALAAEEPLQFEGINEESRFRADKSELISSPWSLLSRRGLHTQRFRLREKRMQARHPSNVTVLVATPSI
jgi:hypothetical protein